MAELARQAQDEIQEIAHG